MKINTHKLLLLLYSEKELAISYDHLGYLWPELSPSGRRSLISLLVKKRLLEPRSVNLVGPKDHQVKFQLTSMGRRAAENSYKSILDPAEATPSMCLLLLEPPQMDPGFVLLKARIAKLEAIRANPKAFFLLQYPSEDFIRFVEEGYFYNVALFQMGSWKVGEWKQFFQQYIDSKEVFSSLSGISRELGGLILKQISFSILNHQSNLDLFSVLDRFFSVLLPLKRVRASHSELSKSCKSLLEQLQSLIFRT